jgi:hypothetical protein
LRAARQLHQHAQRLDHRALAHRGAADGAEAAFAVQDAAVAGGDGDMHQADRLAGRRTAGTGDPGDRYCEVDAGAFQRADRHRGRGFLADGAERLQRRDLDAEHRALGVVGISDKAAIDHVG